MKKIILLLTLGATIGCPVSAQSTNTPPPPPDRPHREGHRHALDFLTESEKAELKKARDAAIAADPILTTQEESIHREMRDAHKSGTPPTEEQKAAFKAFREKMDAALIKADAAVAPILEKIKAHHHGPGGPDANHDGPPPPPAGA